MKTLTQKNNIIYINKIEIKRITNDNIIIYYDNSKLK